MCEKNKIDLSAKIEILHKLATDAQQRFQERREYEWKICFGIWTSLAAATGLVLNSSWKPGQVEFWGAVGIATTLCLTFIFFFSLWIHNAHAYDKDVRNHWQNQINELVLRFEASSCPQPRAAWTQRIIGKVLPDAEKCPWLHPISIGQVLVTIAFSTMFVGAVWSKQTKRVDVPPRDVSILGLSYLPRPTKSNSARL